MSTAAGLRNQRLRLYAPVDRGSDGYVHGAYVFECERWGRLDETRAATSLMQERLQTRVDALAEFADEVVPPMNGVLVDATDRRAWWVRGITHARQTRRRIVGLERISDERFKELDVYDAPSALDGSHVINTPFSK